MSCHQFKGGIGTSSRTFAIQKEDFTLGLLVQANYGTPDMLTIAGVPVGREITDLMPEYPTRDIEFGSIIVAIATDAPLLLHQLKRLARRVPMGMVRLGAYGSHASGDIFLAFSTANPGAGARAGTQQLQMLPNDDMNALFDATVQATEEAIINAMVAARTMTGINGNTKHAIPHQRLMQIIRGYQRC